MTMTDHQAHDPINEAHAHLDQLSRVAIGSILQLAELKARRSANRAARQRDEQVVIAKSSGAQLERDYRTVAPPGTAAEPATLASDQGEPWRAVGDQSWWATATGEDLGTAWVAASADGAAGNGDAAQALDEMKHQVAERWGVSLDQGGAVVELAQPSVGAATGTAAGTGEEALSVAPDGAANPASAVPGNGTVLPGASPPLVVVPDTIEALLSEAHPRSAAQDLAAAVAAQPGDDPSAPARRLAIAQRAQRAGEAGLG
ncbi:MAG TPA: hypothetical protein VN786_03670 [Acidimicrobiales bacterium]|nr:hypothetical protein [Acidimicrobiales bacterium]